MKTQTQPTHTQGEWKAKGSERNLSTWVEDSNGKRICSMKVSETDWDNAKRIVKAVNMHDELIEAIKTLQGYLNSPHEIRHENKIIWEEYVKDKKKILQLLKQAEQK